MSEPINGLGKRVVAVLGVADEKQPMLGEKLGDAGLGDTGLGDADLEDAGLGDPGLDNLGKCEAWVKADFSSATDSCRLLTTAGNSKDT